MSEYNELPPKVEVVDEVISAEYKPIDLELGGQQFTIYEASRDLQLSDHNYPFGIYDFVLAAKPYHMPDKEVILAGFQDGQSIVMGRDFRSRNGEATDFDYSPYLSKKHAKITRQGTAFHIEDLNSMNGTYHLVGLEHAVKPNIGEPVDTLRKMPQFGDPELRLAAASLASLIHPSRNEDAFFVGSRMPAIGVFDGVDTAAGSELASRVAAQSSKNYLSNLPVVMIRSLARNAMYESLWFAHERILEQAAEAEEPALTTATVARVFQTERGSFYAGVASVGDSRAYLYRDGSLSMMTLDHAFIPGVQDEREAMKIQQTLAGAVDLSQLSESERLAFNKRNLITSALGDESKPPVIKVSDFAISHGDTILLTSDGVHDNLATQEIGDVLRQTTNAGAIVEQLVHDARKRSRQHGVHARAKHDDMTAAAMLLI